MSRLKFPVKDSAEVLDYSFDCSDWLATGDAITSATVTHNGGMGDTLTISAVATTPNSVRCWASGGTNARTYLITSTATTTAGRTVRRSAQLPVSSR
jgi:hypothetical protein